MAELFYVIGASGAGKDSILNYARLNIRSEMAVAFAHRYITRPADAGGENHIALSEEEFSNRAQMGCFALQWYSHNKWYGIGVEINQWLAMGLHVVVNGSRAYLDVALRNYPNMIPVLVSVAPQKLRDRLVARGREERDEIEARVVQATALERTIQHPRLAKIDNDGVLADAGECLIKLIHDRNKCVCS
ncbi:MAG: phosphonate metabolism protein/1,5-bisphosphokinase (PRPP-forming) PhnN [gamma proteobacterium symbiont of Ctena orbiculata]|nr:MAG: phosphonate metabolism protein/1,5-bisphosphokinase (PRPP-forming) PhnN [gamma proteobacterium symbiont of Ctena orbiculata]PVV20634.1 MAG: phosphonate metabolism protein/1,5-bisphosphokinase (PRPP-forming) PhnN [gamma proteobacterium symbiont of Ctena orbiculata]